jgi:hypothetical protein
MTQHERITRNHGYQKAIPARAAKDLLLPFGGGFAFT